MIYLESVGGRVTGRDELVTELRIEEGVGRAAALRHGQDLDGQIGNVLREGYQRGQRCLSFRRVDQNESVHQVIPVNCSIVQLYSKYSKEFPVEITSFKTIPRLDCFSLHAIPTF